MCQGLVGPFAKGVRKPVTEWRSGWHKFPMSSWGFLRGDVPHSSRDPRDPWGKVRENSWYRVLGKGRSGLKGWRKSRRASSNAWETKELRGSLGSITAQGTAWGMRAAPMAWGSGGQHASHRAVESTCMTWARGEPFPIYSQRLCYPVPCYSGCCMLPEVPSGLLTELTNWSPGCAV